MAVAIGTKRTAKTQRRLQKALNKSDLSHQPILINLGNSNQKVIENWKKINPTIQIINQPQACKNCSQKRKMYKILAELAVPNYDLTDPNRYLQATNRIKSGQTMIIPYKIGQKKETNNPYNLTKYEYCTEKQEKEKEYRIVLYKGKVLRAMIKLPYNSQELQRKQYNCKFVTLSKNYTKIIRPCREAQRRLQVDLCGIDLIKNTNGQYQICEVNSGMSLSKKTIKRLIQAIQREKEERKWKQQNENTQ